MRLPWPDSQVAAEYVSWLENGHVDLVVNAGAHSAMIVRIDTPAGIDSAAGPIRVMTQYVFPTRAVFDRYVAEFAPALRAEGLARFGPERGIRMERLTGEIV